MYAEKNSLAAMVKRNALSSFIFLSLASISNSAMAEGLYAGVNYGNFKTKDRGACAAATSVLNANFSCTGVADDKDHVAKIFGGYGFMPHVAVELGYISFGDTTATASGTLKGTGTAATARTKLKSKGFVFAFVGTLPFTNEFSLIGRIGTYRWNVQSEATTSAGNSALAKDTKPGFALDNIGIGAEYNFSKTMGLRMEWERYLDVGSSHITGQTQIDSLTLGLIMKF